MSAEGRNRRGLFVDVYGYPSRAYFLVLLSAGVYGCLLLFVGSAVNFAVTLNSSSLLNLLLNCLLVLNLSGCLLPSSVEQIH